MQQTFIHTFQSIPLYQQTEEHIPVTGNKVTCIGNV